MIFVNIYEKRMDEILVEDIANKILRKSDHRQMHFDKLGK